MNCLPKIMLDNAVAAFRTLSHQPDGPWMVQLADGRCVEAVHLLQQFQHAARRELGGRDTETDLLLSIWEETLAALAPTAESLVGRVDWITKRWLLQKFCDQEHISWSDPWLKSQDLEYHQIDPARSLGLALARTPPPWELSAKEITRAIWPAAGQHPRRRPLARHAPAQERTLLLLY